MQKAKEVNSKTEEKKKAKAEEPKEKKKAKAEEPKEKKKAENGDTKTNEVRRHGYEIHVIHGDSCFAWRLSYI